MGKLRIASHSNRVFADRVEAGRLLAGELRSFKDKEAVVLGILRGGMIVAREIALELGVELDIALSLKISSPTDSECAVGAVSETGKIFTKSNNPDPAQTALSRKFKSPGV